jgi:hypothetical protein
MTHVIKYDAPAWRPCDWCESENVHATHQLTDRSGWTHAACDEHARYLTIYATGAEKGSA